MPSTCVCWRHCCVIGIFLILGFGFSGCNVFDGVQSEPASVEDLLADARIAMTKTNHQRAVRLLEEAFEKDSTHVEVRIELVNALFAAHGVDAFTVRSAVEHVNEGVRSNSVDTEGDVCSDGVDPDRSPERFRVVTFEGQAVRTLLGQRERIRRASDLLVDGVLQQRAEAFGQQSPDVRMKGYLLAALTQVSLRMLALEQGVRETAGTLYVDTEAQPSWAFVACAGTEETLSRIEQSLCRLKDEAARAVAWLQARNEAVGSERTTFLIDLLEAHVAAAQVYLSCPASRALREKIRSHL